MRNLQRDFTLRNSFSALLRGANLARMICYGGYMAVSRTVKSKT
jgi:hypothetical protein